MLFVFSFPASLVGTISIEKPFINNLLGKHLTNHLCATISKCDILYDQCDIDQIMKCKTIKEFDTHFTSKHFGYKDVDHYYSVATLHNKLHKIAVPLLCLSAADDPFQPLDAIPTEAAEHSSHVAIAVTARGGHIGFMDGCIPKTNDEYMARLFGQYFKTVLFDENFSRIVGQMLNKYQSTSQETAL